MTAAPPLRVALFADCFHEINGVANTLQRLERFARDRSLPLLCIRAAKRPGSGRNGSVETCEFARNGLRVPVDRDLFFDPLFARHLPALRRAVESFRPDVIHVTGPGDAGILGVLIARILKLPLVASWHTNVHEFAALRLRQAGLPGRWCAAAERTIFDLAALYYRIPCLLLAPNPELVRLLGQRTSRPVREMSRGVDASLFHPRHRRRSAAPAGLTLGYVGRLTPEKNVGMLGSVGRALHAAGVAGCSFLIVGDGGERAALAQALPEAQFTGVLRGEALAEAYASMDVLLFPSHADTFGNVVLEALASGVPALVTNSGGPKFIVEHGVTGWVAQHNADFVARAVALAAAPSELPAMRRAARLAAESRSWDRVFESVYRAYAFAVGRAAQQPLQALAVDTAQIDDHQAVEAVDHPAA